jgi:transcriptional regulator with XRE-family HTH domain
MTMPDHHKHQSPAPGLDGPTLRAVRENIRVPLRRIARMAGMSHGHLSKVERGEHGRPVTPAILRAYEKVTGVNLTEAAGQVAERRDRDTGRGKKDWKPGQLTDMRRRAYNAAIGAIAIGGHLGEPVIRLLDSTGRAVSPAPPDELDIEQLWQQSELLTAMDMRCGGGLVSQLAKAVLRWAHPMLDAYGVSEEENRKLHSVIGVIAHRAAWAAFDVLAHEAARSLFRLALYTAAQGEDHNLRGHVLADIAAQHNQLGYRRDALDIIRLGEGDERIAPTVRVVLHGAKARTYGGLGEADDCRRQIEAAEEAFTLASTDQPGWVGRLANPAKLYAITGQAMADLAECTGEKGDREEAIHGLGKAVDELDSINHARARGLCLSRLTTLLVINGDLSDEEWPEWLKERAPEGVRVRSGRLSVASGSGRTQSEDSDATTGEPAS